MEEALFHLDGEAKDDMTVADRKGLETVLILPVGQCRSACDVAAYYSGI